MPNTLKIGLDVSINSTGLVIDDQNQITFHKIISEPKGKHSTSVTTHSYDRVFANDDYSVDNICKIISGEKLANTIKQIILEALSNSDATDISIRMEGSAMGGFGNKSRADDMTNFSAIVKRKMISIKEVKTISVIPPTTLKLFSTGKGNSKKDAILESFYTIFPEYDQQGKNDDIADAYFLTQISEESNITTWDRENYQNIYQHQTTTKSIAHTKPIKRKKKAIK